MLGNEHFQKMNINGVYEFKCIVQMNVVYWFGRNCCSSVLSYKIKEIKWSNPILGNLFILQDKMFYAKAISFECHQQNLFYSWMVQKIQLSCKRSLLANSCTVYILQVSV